MARLLVLASTSPFRRELLARLQIPFETVAPDADESALPDESPAATAARLSEAKARAVPLDPKLKAETLDTIQRNLYHESM